MNFYLIRTPVRRGGYESCALTLPTVRQATELPRQMNFYLIRTPIRRGGYESCALTQPTVRQATELPRQLGCEIKKSLIKIENYFRL